MSQQEQSEPSGETLEESSEKIEQAEIWNELFSSFGFQENDSSGEQEDLFSALDFEPTPPQDLSESETDWFILANQLRQQNQELVKTIVNLEQTLTENQPPQTNFLLQKEQEKVVILTEQSAASQIRIAQLEGELLNKNQELLIAEKQLQELKARLSRQQRYTLHYQAALNNHTNSPISATIEPWSNSSEVQEDTNIQSALLKKIQSNPQVSPVIVSNQSRNKKVDLPSFLTEGN